MDTVLASLYQQYVHVVAYKPVMLAVAVHLQAPITVTACPRLSQLTALPHHSLQHADTVVAGRSLDQSVTTSANTIYDTVIASYSKSLNLHDITYLFFCD